jgi:hypothetical protein
MTQEPPDDANRRARWVLRPYEWTHLDGRFAEWLDRQGLSSDNWAPPAWATSARAGRSR